MGLRPARFALVVFCFLLSASTGGAPAARNGGQVWLAVSDIHLDPFDRSDRPSDFGSDSNAALFRSALFQMKRAVPDPSVVLLPGDFLEHHFAQRVRESGAADTPDKAGLLTMQQISSAFGRAFPSAQFAIALGNNDAPCGDYWSMDGSAYLAHVARIWAPLVDRHNAAPDFAASFARYGHYSASSPVSGLRLIVLNTVLLSEQYRGNCGSSYSDAANELTWLKRILRSSPSGAHNVIIMHIPPGFDAFATQFVKGFFAWPYLKAPYDRALAGILSASSNRIAYAIAGHAHRFDFRLAGNVPIVVLGALSPVLDNNPAFYALHVAGDGSLRDIDVYVFDESLQKWLPKRSFDATWGITQIDAASLARLHARLGADPAMRSAWGAQAIGSAHADVASAGTWGTHWWRVQWCAQTSFGSNYASCANIHGRLQVLRIATIALIAAAVATLVLLGANRGARRAQAGSKRS